MRLSVFKTHDELSRSAAGHIIQLVIAKPNAVLCLATGNTPGLTYKHVVELAKKDQVDFSRARIISLDEWVDIPRTNPGSCYSFLHEHIFAPLEIHHEQINFFNGQAVDLIAECQQIDKKIHEVDGIDLMVLGIGMNGHIGFNEPGVSNNLKAHVAELDDATRVVGKKYFSGEVELKRGITLGISQILAAKKIIMLANGSSKSDIVKRTLEEEISNFIPASFVLNHPNSFIFLDELAAEKLSQRPSVNP